jgi:hypothetical protein
MQNSKTSVILNVPLAFLSIQNEISLPSWRWENLVYGIESEENCPARVKGMAQAVEQLPCKCKPLSSNPSTTTMKKNVNSQRRN